MQSPIRYLVLALLLAAHVAFALLHRTDAEALADWLLGGQWTESVVREVCDQLSWSVVAPQLALVVGWLAMSRKALLVRAPAATILLALIAVSVFDRLWSMLGHWSNPAEIALFSAAVFLPALAMLVLLLLPAGLWGGCRIDWRGSAPAAPERGAQFTLREVFGWTIGAALVFGLARMSLPAAARTLPASFDLGMNVYLLAVLGGVCSALRVAAAAWAFAAALKKVPPYALVAAGLCLLIVLIEKLGAALIGVPITRFETKMLYLSAGAEFAVLGSTVLILRGCGLCFENSATKC